MSRIRCWNERGFLPKRRTTRNRTTETTTATTMTESLGYLNWRHVSSVSAYVLVGIIMWVAVLKSGVHATLAGVALAMFIPMRSKEEPDRSPLRELEHDLHSVVAFGVLPLFAFVNAGISFAGMSFADLLHPVSLGIASERRSVPEISIATGSTIC